MRERVAPSLPYDDPWSPYDLERCPKPLCRAAADRTPMALHDRHLIARWPGHPPKPRTAARCAGHRVDYALTLRFPWHATSGIP